MNPDHLAEALPALVTVAIWRSGLFGRKFIRDASAKAAELTRELGHDKGVSEMVQKTSQDMALGVVAATSSVAALVSCLLDSTSALVKPHILAWIPFVALIICGFCVFLFLGLIVNRSPIELSSDRLERFWWLRWPWSKRQTPYSRKSPTDILGFVTLLMVLSSLAVGAAKVWAATVNGTA